MVFSSPDFPTSITLQPLSDLLHNTLWPVHRINHQIHQIDSLCLTGSSLQTYTLAAPGPSLRFHFFESHTNIPYVTAHHTRNLYFFHIRCSNAVTTFETSRIYNKTISKFIPQNHYDQETWTFWWDSQIMFSYLFQNSDAYSLTQHRPPPNTGFHSHSKELVYMCSCYKFVCLLFTQETKVTSNSTFAPYKPPNNSTPHNICPPQLPAT